jgi:hypothetical protein
MGFEPNIIAVVLRLWVDLIGNTYINVSNFGKTNQRDRLPIEFGIPFISIGLNKLSILHRD